MYTTDIYATLLEIGAILEYQNCRPVIHNSTPLPNIEIEYNYYQHTINN